MTYVEIVDIILTHKGLSKYNLKNPEPSIIEYRLDNSVYKINLINTVSTVTLLYEIGGDYNDQGIHFAISKRVKTPETIIRNFKKEGLCLK